MSRRWASAGSTGWTEASPSVASVASQRPYEYDRPRTAAACSGNENAGTPDPRLIGPSRPPRTTATTGLSAPSDAPTTSATWESASASTAGAWITSTPSMSVEESAAVTARRNSPSPARQSNGNSTGSSPAVPSAAVARTPGLREFVTTATRGPRSTGWLARTLAVSSRA